MAQPFPFMFFSFSFIAAFFVQVRFCLVTWNISNAAEKQIPLRISDVKWRSSFFFGMLGGWDAWDSLRIYRKKKNGRTHIFWINSKFGDSRWATAWQNMQRVAAKQRRMTHIIAVDSCEILSGCWRKLVSAQRPNPFFFLESFRILKFEMKNWNTNGGKNVQIDWIDPLRRRCYQLKTFSQVMKVRNGDFSD